MQRIWMFGRFWGICLRYMNIFSLCCFFLHSNFLEIISHLSHIIASPTITNLFYLFFCTAFFSLFLALIALLCLICLYFKFLPTFFFILEAFTPSLGLQNHELIFTIIHPLFFSLSIEDIKSGQKSGLLQSHTHRGRETEYHCRAEIKTSHSFYCSLFFGAGLFMMLLGHFYVSCSWSNASFL